MKKFSLILTEIITEVKIVKELWIIKLWDGSWTKTIVTICFEAKLAPSSVRAEFITLV